MEDWQRKVVEDKKRDRVSRHKSKDMLANYSGSAGVKEEDLKLKLMREEHRKKQQDAKQAMHKYKKNELSEDDLKLRALREEQRRKQEDAKEAMHKYKKNELSEDDLKLRALREEDRRKQEDAKEAMHKYKKNELSEDDLKLRAFREEDRRKQEDAERAMHNYKKTELSEEDLKLRALREEDRKKQQDAEKMWRTFQNNDVKGKKLAVRKEVTHPPVERGQEEDILGSIASGSVSERAAALKHASPPRPVEKRGKWKRPGDASYSQDGDSTLNDTYEEDEDVSNASGLVVADPFDSIQAGTVSAAALQFTGSSCVDIADYSRSTVEQTTASTGDDDEDKPDTTTTGDDDHAETEPREVSVSQEQPESVVSESSEAAPVEQAADKEEEAPPSESASEQPVDESEKEASDSEQLVEEPAVVPEQPVETAEEAEPVKENADNDETEVSEQPVEEPAVVPEQPVESVEEAKPVEENADKDEKEASEQPVEEPVVVEEEEEEEPVADPAVVAVDEPVTEPVEVTEEEPVNELADDTEEEPAKEPAVTEEERPVEAAVKSESEASEKEPAADAADQTADSDTTASEPVVEKEPTKEEPPQTAFAPAEAYTQPAEDSKVVKRAQYICAQSGEEKKLEVTDDILHVLDDEEETKPLVGQTSKVRLDVLFSFGLLTTSEKPTFSNYLLAVEDIVKRTLIDKPDVAQHVSYDKEFGPFVQEYNKDDTYVDPKGRDYVRRVVVIAAIPVFLSNGISIRTARESICADLQGAIVSGEFVYLAKTTFNQKKQKQ